MIPIGAGLIDVKWISMDDVFAIGTDGSVADDSTFPTFVVESSTETKS